MPKPTKKKPTPNGAHARELERVREERRALERVTREEMRVRAAIGQLRRSHAATAASLRELYRELSREFELEDVERAVAAAVGE